MPKKTLTFTSELLTANVEPEDYNGRLVYRFPCKFLAESYSKGNVKGCVMNQGLFQPNDIQKSVSTWDRKQVTLEHPTVSVKYNDREYEVDVSANDPEAQLRHSFGAWMINAERVYNKKKKWYNVSAEIVVDVNHAESTEQGRRALRAFKTGKPISCSIGCTATIEFVDDGGDDYFYVVHNIDGDHLAMLLDSEPAHSVDEGTGMNMSAVDRLRKLSNTNKMLLTHNSIMPNITNTGEELPADIMEFIAMSKTTTANATVKEQETALIEEGSVEDPSDTSREVEMVTESDTPSTAEVAVKFNGNEYTQEDFDKLVDEAVKVRMAELTAEEEHAELVNQVTELNIVSKDTANTFGIGVLKEMIQNAKVATPLVTAKPTTQSNFNANESILSPKFNRASKENSNG